MTWVSGGVKPLVDLGVWRRVKPLVDLGVWRRAKPLVDLGFLGRTDSADSPQSMTCIAC
jgi:hypothetical protein